MKNEDDKCRNCILESLEYYFEMYKPESLMDLIFSVELVFIFLLINIGGLAVLVYILYLLFTRIWG